LHQNGGKWFADAPGIKGFDLRTGIQEVWEKRTWDQASSRQHFLICRFPNGVRIVTT